MDPGTALSVVSLGIQVFHGLISYYESWKSYEQDIGRTHNALAVNLNTLEALQNAFSKTTSAPFHAQAHAEEIILSCRSGIQSLQKKLEKIQPCQIPDSSWSKIQSHGRRAFYPFRESTLSKLREIVADLRDDLTLALQVLQMQAQDSLSYLPAAVLRIRSLIFGRN
jgi:hypothetical protein